MTFITTSRTIEQIISRTTAKILREPITERRQIKLWIGYAVRHAVHLTRTGKVPSFLYRQRIRNRRTVAARGRTR